MFDNRDIYYSWNGQDQTLDDYDLYVLVGLNHNLYNLTISNSVSIFAVTDPDNGNAFQEIDTITNIEYSKYHLENFINDCDECQNSVFCNMLKPRLLGMLFHDLRSAGPNSPMEAATESRLFVGKPSLGTGVSYA